MCVAEMIALLYGQTRCKSYKISKKKSCRKIKCIEITKIRHYYSNVYIIDINMTRAN